MATETSHQYRQIAQQLMEQTPLELGQEVALTGSGARGVADADSDMEINFWVTVLPDEQTRYNWIASLGATSISLDSEPIEDGSIWALCQLNGIWLELGWQTIAQQEQLLQALLAGKIIDKGRLIVATIIINAFILRSEGLIADWQQRLKNYPEILSTNIINDAIELWTFPHIVQARWALARRQQYFALHQRLTQDIDNLLRVIFAANHQWPPDWKWLSLAVAQLSLKPLHLVERINEICAVMPMAQRVEATIQLIIETLTLVMEKQPSSHLAQAIEVLRVSRPTPNRD